LQNTNKVTSGQPLKTLTVAIQEEGYTVAN
jgi:hypothetical protein